jgi:hypothetical protein
LERTEEPWIIFYYINVNVAKFGVLNILESCFFKLPHFYFRHKSRRPKMIEREGVGRRVGWQILD